MRPPFTLSWLQQDAQSATVVPGLTPAPSPGVGKPLPRPHRALSICTSSLVAAVWELITSSVVRLTPLCKQERDGQPRLCPIAVRAEN